MKTMLLLLSILSLASCGTGTSVFFGPDGIRIVSPEQAVVVPTKPLVSPTATK